MRFLLVAPPRKGPFGGSSYPPIGLGYLATVLRDMGHEPVIKDCIINGWTIEDLLSYIYTERPDVVGINIFSSSVAYAKNILDGIKQKNSKIITIIGGPHPTGVPAESLEYLSTADYGIVGEGEIPLRRLVTFLESGHGKKEDISGLIWREGNSIRFNQKVENKNIDDFGFPAWDLINPDRYFHLPWIGLHTGVILTSRGCPFSCEFCVKLGRKLRYRSLDKIYEELLLLHDQYGIDRFIIQDEGFPIDTRFTKAFCRFMIDKGNKFKFVSGSGLRLSVLDDELLELLKQANLDPLVGVGIESGVQRVRNLMKKSLTDEQLYKGIDLLNKHGFLAAGNFILGYPGETKEEMEETIRVATKLNLHSASFIPFAPLPGSEATKKLIAKGELTKDVFTQINLDAVLYAPEGMTRDEIGAMRRKAVFRFNIRPKRLLFHITGGRLPFTFMKLVRIFFPSFLVPKSWRINQ